MEMLTHAGVAQNFIPYQSWRSRSLSRSLHIYWL